MGNLIIMGIVIIMMVIIAWLLFTINDTLAVNLNKL